MLQRIPTGTGKKKNKLLTNTVDHCSRAKRAPQKSELHICPFSFAVTVLAVYKACLIRVHSITNLSVSPDHVVVVLLERFNMLSNLFTVIIKSGDMDNRITFVHHRQLHAPDNNAGRV